MNEWLEKELEDYVVAHPQELCAKAFQYFHHDVSVLGRQVRCQFGIIDVLLWMRDENASYVLIVECKAKHEKGLAVEQTTRYQQAVSYAGIYDDLPSDAWPTLDEDNDGWGQYIDIQTVPIIVAPSFDRKLAATYHGTLITAQKVGDKFIFDYASGNTCPSVQNELDAALAPVIYRARTSARAQHISRRLKNGLSVIPQYYDN